MLHLQSQASAHYNGTKHAKRLKALGALKREQNNVMVSKESTKGSQPTLPPAGPETAGQFFRGFPSADVPLCYSPSLSVWLIFAHTCHGSVYPNQITYQVFFLESAFFHIQFQFACASLWIRNLCWSTEMFWLKGDLHAQEPMFRFQW